MSENNVLLDVKNLRLSFFTPGGEVQSLRDVSFQLKEGEVVNLRGYGKFIFDGMQNETKKGKLNVKIRIYK